MAITRAVLDAKREHLLNEHRLANERIAQLEADHDKLVKTRDAIAGAIQVLMDVLAENPEATGREAAPAE